MASSALATAFVNIVPGTQAVENYLKTGLGAQVASGGANAGATLGNSMGSKFKSVFGAVASTIGIGLGINAVAGWVRASNDSYAAEQAGQAQTAAAIKSTGGVAKVTAKEVEGLAQSLEGLTATDADQIRTGENLLLTFTNIRNGVGKGNDIFNQATQAAVDMSRAMGTDVSSSAMQLGKALQDPVKGVAALQRVGVRLTDSQKAQVEALVKTGDTMGAQKIILQELNTEFGGSGAAYADTYAGKMFAMSDAMDDLGKKVIGNLEPALGGFADLMTKTIVPALEGMGSFFKEYLAPIMTFVGVIGALTIALNLQAIATAILTSNTWLWTAALLTNPITWVVIVVAALVAGIVLLATKTTFFQDIWAGMTKWITGAWNAVVGFFSTTFTNIGTWFKNLWAGATNAWNSFSKWIGGAVGAIGGFFKTAFGAIGGFFKTIVNGWIGIFESFINFFVKGINGMIGGLNLILDGIKTATGGAISLHVNAIPLVKLPRLAKGGFVDSPTIAQIGEAGPEVVTPLKDFERMMGLNNKKATEQPIYADGIGLLGWIRQEAEGQAKLVFNTELSRATRGIR